MNRAEAREFLEILSAELADRENLDAFIANMEKLKHQDMTGFEWWETYLLWSEMGTEEDMEAFYE